MFRWYEPIYKDYINREIKKTADSGIENFAVGSQPKKGVILLVVGVSSYIPTWKAPAPVAPFSLQVHTTAHQTQILLHC